MKDRAPVASFGLAIGILLAGTGLGSHGDTPGPAETIAAPGPAEVAIVSQTAEAPVVAITQSAPVPAETLPTPRDAPASASVAGEMKHVWQSPNNCGPAAVVMALSTFGVDTSQEVARLALRGADIRRGMGPQPVDPWVKQSYGLRAVWRNNGRNDLMKRLIANGFVPMVTQWMQDPSVSRIAHWRTLRGYDDAQGIFYVNDPMLGNNVALAYGRFERNWQSFAYRYMVIYRPESEPLLRAVIGRDWSDPVMRQALYERARHEATELDTDLAWLAYGEAAYANGVFDEAVTAFERGFSAGSASGVFGVRNSYPQALRALGRRQEADVIAQKISGITPVPSAVASAPDSYAIYLALRRSTAFESLPTE